MCRGRGCWFSLVAILHGRGASSPVEVGGQVRPLRHVRRRGVCVAQHRATSEREVQIAQDGGVALEARVDFVEDASVEGASGGGVRGIRVHEALDLGARRFRIIRGEIIDDVVLRGDVRQDEAEEGALVFLVADDEGDARHARAGFARGAGVHGEEGVVRVVAREVGEVEGAVAEDFGHGGGGFEEFLVR